MLGRVMKQLMKHGTGVAVGIPRPLLYELNWLCGQNVIVELLEDRSAVVVRKPRLEDFGPTTPPRLIHGDKELER
jgi:antitoxin component of MazEF toxin-antitoxin module